MLKKPYIINFLNYNTPLKYHNVSFLFKKKIIFLIRINNLLYELIPKKIHPYCQVINFRNNLLIIGVSDISWKLYLSNLHDKLIIKLRSKILPNLSNIIIKINPNLISSYINLSNNEIKSIKFTNKSINAINALVNISHGSCKNSLKKLANIMLLNLMYHKL
ncbi:MAG: DciA family protein [Candidatus Lightella neohaematopini]|nr:DciA family protein [Candidatus Lightella neohaematopini]MCV2528741.1 DciA family protein [Candidatus Lightella neohaematopini]